MADCACCNAFDGSDSASCCAASRCRCASDRRVRASAPTAPRRVEMKSAAADTWDFADVRS
ncbi:hypothetical protein GS416_06930 [Rhodococcus hoagii]|nr:hypothetical protein [Prescottella equi]